MNDMKDYTLNLDGPAFRAQRELLLRIADLVRRKQPYTPAPGDEGLLEGLWPDRRDCGPGSRPARHRLPVARRRGGRCPGHRLRHCKTVRVPVEITFTPTPPNWTTARANRPRPKKASSPISRMPLSWKWTRKATGSPRVRPSPSLGIDWDAATLTGEQDTSR